jgi:hypothetical protein
VRVPFGDDDGFGHVPHRAHVRDDRRHARVVLGDLLDGQRRAERVVQRVDQHR